MDKVKVFLSNRTNLVLVLLLGAILIGIIFAATRFLSSRPKAQVSLQEVELSFDPEGPYALLVPRRDGDALVLNITRIASYESIAYELAYSSLPSEVSNLELAEGEGEGGAIQRGVTGTLNFEKKKGEHSQEILFGTCSQGFTSGTAHCTFDKGVENGTLVLKIQKGDILYKMNTAWHLQKPDVALGKITSSDNHFMYTTDVPSADLVSVAYTIVNEMSGVPKLPEGKEVLGKVYALNVPTAKSFPAGEVVVELAENPPSEAKLFQYKASENSWKEMVTKVDGSKLSAPADGEGIFAVLVNASNK